MLIQKCALNMMSYQPGHVGSGGFRWPLRRGGTLDGHNKEIKGCGDASAGALMYLPVGAPLLVGLSNDEFASLSC